MDHVIDAIAEDPNLETPPVRVSRVRRAIVLSLLVLFTAGTAFVGFHYVRLARMVDRKLKAGPFSNTSTIYAAPGKATLRRPVPASTHDGPLGKNREKRRLVKFADIPSSLVHALVSAEDKRFFQQPIFPF